MADDALHKVAYDEAVRALSEQHDAIESVRTRAGLLLSASAVTTSFLGAQALGAAPSSCAWLALLCFIAVAVTSLAILWPRAWEFAAYPSGVGGGRIDSEDVQVGDLYRDLSLRMHGCYLENFFALKHLAAFFQVASALLTIEVILWVVAIASDL